MNTHNSNSSRPFARLADETLNNKIDQLLAQQADDEKEKAVNRFVFRAGASLVGLLATAALSVSGWALAQSNRVVALETEQVSVREITARHEAAINAVEDDVGAVERDVSAIRADIAHMTTLLNAQNRRLDALLEARTRGGR